jgi:hypothetical protein
MKTMILSTVIAFLIASPVQAAPITWFFFGTTTSLPTDDPSILNGKPSMFNGVPVTAGSAFQFRILLDTLSPGRHTLSASAEVIFDPVIGADWMGLLAIGGSVLPVDPIPSVEYFTRCVDQIFCNETKSDFKGREVTGINIEWHNDAAKQGISFVRPIETLATAPFELGPIGASIPRQDLGGGKFDDILEFEGPNLLVFGKVDLFAAASSVEAIPEGGSTLLFLTSALVALGFLRRRGRTLIALEPSARSH